MSNPKNVFKLGNDFAFKVNPEQVTSWIGTVANVKEVCLLDYEAMPTLDRWKALAIKFKDESPEAIIKSMTRMRVDEYLGKEGDYYMFWWD